MDIVEVKKGDFGLELDFVDNQLVFKIGADTKGVDISLAASVDAEYFLDLLKKAIPGEIDDIIIETIKGAMKVI